MDRWHQKLSTETLRQTRDPSKLKSPSEDSVTEWIRQREAKRLKTVPDCVVVSKVPSKGEDPKTAKLRVSFADENNYCCRRCVNGIFDFVFAFFEKPKQNKIQNH